jgi:hypothetical protein
MQGHSGDYQIIPTIMYDLQQIIRIYNASGGYMNIRVFPYILLMHPPENP